ncbi:MAG: alanine--tRNA ligase [Candidatus Berkelbacteria bacterium]
MNSKVLRQKFLSYFESKGHKIIPSASLVPENDPTVLFTTAGMHPLVPNLMGEKHPSGAKLCNIQRCVRTGDIDEVGDKTHCTFFEMLGYWSLGDYFKADAIKFIFGFLTEELDIDPKNLAVTCFEGDEKNGIPKDDEAADVWKSLGISSERIAFLGREDNWWGPAGTTGPCGPDTEVFVWTGGGDAPDKYDPTDKNWVEICNDVFMQYNKTKDGKFDLLAQKNVDFGGGMERILAYLDGRDNVFQSDLFNLILSEIERLSGKKYENYIKEFRIVADHLKAATFMISDGVVPLNKDQGYVLRRLIRRAIVKAHQIGISENFTHKIAEKVFETYDGDYPFNNQLVLSELEKEETKFRKTLKDGLKVLDSFKEIDSKSLFDLYQSFGIPLEISLEEANIRGLNIKAETIQQFEELVREHQALSRTASAGMFKGGLADDGVATRRLHTAAHLMLAALRKVLGDHVYQKGSNITAERLRFDFSHPDKMTPEQIEEVEKLVNEQIELDLPVIMAEMSLDEAKKFGAMGVFDSKYGEKVKVFEIGGFSKEICGGPHASYTSELHHFKIQKEESSSSGIRRIKAILD